jgi:hypothetical protein
MFSAEIEYELAECDYFDDILKQIYEMFGYSISVSKSDVAYYFKPKDSVYRMLVENDKDHAPETFHRVANVCAQHRKSRITYIGTMYISERGTWMVINENQDVVLSGSATLEKLRYKLKTTQKPNQRQNRFENIIT